MGEPGHVVADGGQGVNEHHVELQRIELFEKHLEAVGAHDDVDIFPLQEGREEVDLEISGQRGHGANADDLPRTSIQSLERSNQVRAGGKDGIGVVQGHAPGLVEHQLATLALEEIVAELLLELLDLHGQGRRGDVKRFRSPRQAAFMGDGPEVL